MHVIAETTTEELHKQACSCLLNYKQFLFSYVYLSIFYLKCFAEFASGWWATITHLHSTSFKLFIFFQNDYMSAFYIYMHWFARQFCLMQLSWTGLRVLLKDPRAAGWWYRIFWSAVKSPKCKFLTASWKTHKTPQQADGMKIYKRIW